MKLILSLNSYFECHTTIYAFFCKISFISVFFLKGYSFYQATDPEIVFKKFHFVLSAMSLQSLFLYTHSLSLLDLHWPLLFSIPFSYFLSIFLEFPLSVLYSIVMLKLDWEFCLRNNRFYQKISAYRILLQESAEKKLLENISKSIFFFYLLYTWLKWSVILYKDAEKNRALFEVKFMGGHMWKSGQMTPKTLSKWGFWAF